MIENYLFSAGAGFGIGFLVGKAIKWTIKIAAIIVGLFFAALAFLNWKGLVAVNWQAMQNQTQQVAEQAMHVVNQTVSQVATHPQMMHAQALTLTAGIGFLPGVTLGLMH